MHKHVSPRACPAAPTGESQPRPSLARTRIALAMKVIFALVDAKSQAAHSQIPYRDSKLTRLLQVGTGPAPAPACKGSR